MGSANVDWSPVHPDLCDIGRGCERECLGERVIRAGGGAQRDVQRRPGTGAQPERVESLACAEVADIVQTEYAGARRGREVEQVCGGECETLVAEQLLHEVGLEGLLEQ